METFTDFGNKEAAMVRAFTTAADSLWSIDPAHTKPADNG